MTSPNPLSSAISPKACGALSSSCPAAVNDRQQWPLSNDADITRDHSNPAEFPPGCNSPAFGGNLRDRALNGALPVFHSASFDRANGPRSHSIAHQRLVQAATDALHLGDLSNLSSSAGSTNASKRGQIIGNSGQVGAA